MPAFSWSNLMEMDSLTLITVPSSFLTTVYTWLRCSVSTILLMMFAGIWTLLIQEPIVVIMAYSPTTGPDAHPYWYACTLGIFHAWVMHIGTKSTNHSLQDMEFLWVQWFGQVPDHQFSMKAAQLPKVGFILEEDDLAFRFLDPSLVVWGCHLIPSFSKGQTNELLSTTLRTAWLLGIAWTGWHTMWTCMLSSPTRHF